MLLYFLAFTALVYFFGGNNKQQKNQESEYEREHRLRHEAETRAINEEIQRQKRQESERQEAIRQEQRKREEAVKQEQLKIELERKKRENELAKEEKERKEKIRIAAFKNDWEKYQTFLDNNRITKLYHFTDRANIQSIKENGGLCSWGYCRENNIIIPRQGGSETSMVLDQRKGLENYVRVSFVKDHPMMFIAQQDGRIDDPVILEISTDIIFLPETKYAEQNAARNSVNANSSFDKFNSIIFPIFKKRYFNLSDEEKSFYQAEVLVLGKIPSSLILNINNF